MVSPSTWTARSGKARGCFPARSSWSKTCERAGLGVVFASNSSRHASGVLRHRLAELGIVATADQMLAALDLAGEEVRRRLGPVPVLSIGTDELDEILRSCGHTIVPDKEWKSARAVVVGIDPDFSYDRLRAAARAVAAGSTFFAVNMDVRFPVGPGEFDPGCGSLAEAIAVAGGVSPDRDRQAGDALVRGRHRSTGLRTRPGGHGRR